MRLFQYFTPVRLGVTRFNIQALLAEMEKSSPIDEIPIELLAIRMMARMREQNPEDWCEADEAGFDWDSLLEFISQLIELLMPIIVKARPPIPVYTREI